MSNHNSLCRDGIFGNLQIKSRKVLDKDANLCVNEAKIRGNAVVRGELSLGGNLVVEGQVVGDVTGDLCGNVQTDSIAAKNTEIVVKDDVRLLGNITFAGPAPTDGQVLTWNAAAQQWQPQTPVSFVPTYALFEERLMANYTVMAADTIEEWLSITLSPGKYILALSGVTTGATSLMLCTGSAPFDNSDIFENMVIYSAAGTSTSVSYADVTTTTTFRACVRSATGGSLVVAFNAASALPDPDLWSKITAIQIG